MFDSIWYDTLNKPFLNPPAWVFAPVWILLYASLLVALILYAVRFSRHKKISGYIYFVVQMLLNLAWSPAFFTMNNIGLGLAIILLLDLFVIMTIIQFYKVSKLAGLILIPYLLWIIFATYLNISFFILN